MIVCECNNYITLQYASYIMMITLLIAQGLGYASGQHPVLSGICCKTALTCAVRINQLLP